MMFSDLLAAEGYKKTSDTVAGGGQLAVQRWDNGLRIYAVVTIRDQPQRCMTWTHYLTHFFAIAAGRLPEQ